MAEMHLSLTESELEEAVSRAWDYYWNTAETEMTATFRLERELGIGHYDAMVAARVAKRLYNDHIPKFLDLAQD